MTDFIERFRFETPQKAKKAAKWLEKNGFNKDGFTYVACGNTFEIKDKLKEAGFRFNSNLLWHSPVETPEFNTAKVDFFAVATMAAWGEGYYKPTARAYVDEKIYAELPPSKSEYIGEVGDKVDSLKVVYVNAHTFEGYYGLTNIYTFKDGDNVISWFTSVEIDATPGEEVYLSGQIKKCDEYRGEKRTTMTRCKVRKMEGVNA